MDKRPGIMPSQYTWRPIHYLGSKLRVIDSIADLLNQVDPRRGRLCDLFAGSGTVSVAMARERAVTAVDIQEYSRVLCSALLLPPTMSKPKTEIFKNRAISGSLHEQLKWAADPLIQYEKRSLREARGGQFYSICDVIESGSIVSRGFACEVPGSMELRRAAHRTIDRLKKTGLAHSPESVVLRHFGGIYFSYAQAVEIAVLLETAAKQPSAVRQTATAAVLSTASEIVNTVGRQFAQPIRPLDATGKPKDHLIQKIIRDRSIDTFSVFSSWLERYCSLPKADHDHHIIRASYDNALMRHCDNVAVIYADPPYTRDHYSRYYHVLETMCLGDDPQIAKTYSSSKNPVGRGIYRTDRHQSPFCIKSSAPTAFENMFAHVRKMDVPLVLSYSPTPNSNKPRARVMEVENILALASKYFKKVEQVVASGITHSKLNKTELNSGPARNAELFLVCR